MRDYLYLSEIKELLEDHIHVQEDVDEIMVAAVAEAERCLCDARSYGECTCGAWDVDDDVEFDD